MGLQWFRVTESGSSSHLDMPCFVPKQTMCSKSICIFPLGLFVFTLHYWKAGRSSLCSCSGYVPHAHACKSYSAVKRQMGVEEIRLIGSQSKCSSSCRCCRICGSRWTDDTPSLSGCGNKRDLHGLFNRSVGDHSHSPPSDWWWQSPEKESGGTS